MAAKEKIRGRLVLRSVAPDDAGFIAALEEAELLTSGLGGTTGANFAFVNKSREAVGYGGYTVFGKVALLRSITILPQSRMKGGGGRLVIALLSQLQGMDVARVYLLTQGAEFFFEKMGFAALERSLAPEDIEQTDQFQKHCSDEAVFMMRPMDEMMRLDLEEINPVQTGNLHS